MRQRTLCDFGGHLQGFEAFRESGTQATLSSSVSKSQVAPMRILDVDKKYTQGNLDILDHLRKDIELCDDDHQAIDTLNFISYPPT